MLGRNGLHLRFSSLHDSLSLLNSCSRHLGGGDAYHEQYINMKPSVCGVESKKSPQRQVSIRAPRKYQNYHDFSICLRGVANIHKAEMQ